MQYGRIWEALLRKFWLSVPPPTVTLEFAVSNQEEQIIAFEEGTPLSLVLNGKANTSALFITLA